MNKSTLNGVLALTVRELICSFDKDAQPYEAEGNYLSKKREEVVLWCVEFRKAGLKTAKELIWYIPNPEDCR